MQQARLTPINSNREPERKTDTELWLEYTCFAMPLLMIVFSWAPPWVLFVVMGIILFSTIKALAKDYKTSLLEGDD